jgi:hypothetical protein
MVSRSPDSRTFCCKQQCNKYIPHQFEAARARLLFNHAHQEEESNHVYEVHGHHAGGGSGSGRRIVV